jgi:hypothetical protein
MSGGPLVLGFFKHDDGSRWAIVVNRDLRTATEAVLELEAKATSLEELSPQNGKLSRAAMSGRTLSCPLPPGGIKVLKLAN